MLSLGKCHTAEEVFQFTGNKEVIFMTKADGLSCRIIYESGELKQATTRGNGVEGADITEHVKHFTNVPLTIPYWDKYVIDGEAIIPEYKLDEINASLPKGTEPYKNVRNLAAGTLNSLDISVVKERHMTFLAWDVITGNSGNSFQNALLQAKWLGFDTVCCHHLDLYNVSCPLDVIKTAIEIIQSETRLKRIPSDGVVVKYNDISYGESLGRTEHHFNNAIAWKPKAKSYKTILRNIEWNTTRSGAINPKAIYDKILLDGEAENDRATLHNISYIKSLKLGIGDEIEVIRANGVIPKVIKNNTRSDTYIIPKTCPCCSEIAEVKCEENSEVLYCTNEECPAKHLSKLVHFVSRNCMNIAGLSESTLEKFVNKGLIRNFYDIYNLQHHYSDIISLEGMGKKSFNNIMTSIEKSKNGVELSNFICALGIPNVGSGQAKLLSKHFKTWGGLRHAANNGYDFTMIDGIGKVIEKSIKNWFRAEWNENMAKLVDLMSFKTASENNNMRLEDKSFVITGSVNRFKNRNELKKAIENAGGKVSSSVSAKTDYLVCNESSTSSKYIKAIGLNIPIINEEKLIELLGIEVTH